ncbi:hypothetical protein GH714_009369 [Hevea brasiliensis]|uniref:Serine-threonine/tyrosine-protein kinase catalytic domain-containing protein n=1 Tax=Hevea brasiliensis TaxID=3981 RepID=A0A6A6KCY4_HEVBR|nr:hypothetical protein GH714_009369 [Hevea brasiliensis]
MEQTKGTEVFVDNQAAIAISHNPVFHGKTKHFNIKFFFLRGIFCCGYMSLEYAMDGLYSVKSDVFSFGILLLEIVSGKRNRRFSHTDHLLNLLGHAWTLQKEGRSIEMIDASVRNSCNLSEVIRSVHVGLLCVQQNLAERPSMSTVVFMLGSEGALPKPKEPGFFTERDLIELNSSSSYYNSSSTNDLTITQLRAR